MYSPPCRHCSQGRPSRFIVEYLSARAYVCEACLPGFLLATQAAYDEDRKGLVFVTVQFSIRSLRANPLRVNP